MTAASAMVSPTPADVEHLLAELRLDEGWRRKPYRDTAGKLTIGCGRNLDDVGLSDDEIAFLRANDVRRAQADLDAKLPWWSALDAVRQAVLLNMTFNMGVASVLGFRNTLAAVKRGDWTAAAAAMRASRWHAQTGDRAERLATMMETGRYVV